MRTSMIVALAATTILFTVPAAAQPSQRSGDAGSGAKAPQAMETVPAPIQREGAHNRVDTSAIIRSLTTTVRGHEFPSTAKVNPTANSTCEMYQTRSIGPVAPVDIEGQSHVKKSWTSGVLQSDYSPPDPNWIIETWVRTISSAGQPYMSKANAVPGNFSMNSSSNYSAASSDLQSYVGSLNLSGKFKADLSAQINSYITNYSNYSSSLSSSNDLVQNLGQVWGTGTINTSTGHAWLHSYINTTEICAPAEVRSQSDLETTLKNWVNAAVAAWNKRAAEMQ